MNLEAEGKVEAFGTAQPIPTKSEIALIEAVGAGDEVPQAAPNEPGTERDEPDIRHAEGRNEPLQACGIA